MVDAGDVDDVVDVIDEGGKGWGADASGEELVDGVRDVEGDRFAFGEVGRCCLRVKGDPVFAGGVPCLTPRLMDEGGEEIDHADSAFGS